MDGGVSASRYAYVGGFRRDVELRGWETVWDSVRGAHAHSFVQAHSKWDDIHAGGKLASARILQRQRNVERVERGDGE